MEQIPVKYSKVRKILKLDTRRPAVDEGLAAVTHYLQNQSNGSKTNYEKYAEKYLKINSLLEEPTFQYLGGKCVFTSEWDKFSQKTYEANYGEVPFGDITQINEKLIPNHDILLGGFPCQPFSIAGVSKKKSLG